jgi:hypothetical protein
MRTPLSLAILLGAAGTVYGQLPSVIITNTPDYGMPWEANQFLRLGQTNNEREGWSKPIGTFSNVVHRARQIKVRYFDSRWDSGDSVRRYVEGLLRDNKNQVSITPTWAQPVEVPEIEGSILYQHGEVGRMLLWGWVGCFQDVEHRWRFLVLQDYYRQNNPKAHTSTTQPSAAPNAAPPHR